MGRERKKREKKEGEAKGRLAITSMQLLREGLTPEGARRR